ncbi:MAG: hypothetical protein HZB68_02665 [Candidatus Aenigmarchaeota archaeon]|nr:hypothetical protein [Candidatus Aenigmarchaeota archaeon]
MYKKVFDAHNEDSVSYGTAEDKISANGKMIGGLVAGIGFGIGAFYAVEHSGIIGGDKINDVLANQGVINGKIGGLDTQMDSYHNDEMSLLNSINQKVNGTTVPQGYVPAIHDHPGMVPADHAHPGMVPANHAHTDMVPKNHAHPDMIDLKGKDFDTAVSNWLDNNLGGEWISNAAWKDGKITDYMFHNRKP